jgi:sugar O-acyltransferase (sialic acid O-acetyltransferase NeuD family)
MAEEPKKIVIFGNGQIAELAHFYFGDDGGREVAGFCVDAAYLKDRSFLGLPLVTFEEVADAFPPDDFVMFIALGYAKLNKVRAEKYAAAKGLGYRFASYVSSRLYMASNVEIGDNCFILENQTVQPFCYIGANVTLWSGNHIGHHSTIADHAFLASQIVVSGGCSIGERSFVGVNAALRDNLKVGADAVVGMGALVTADVPDGGVVLGQSGEVLAADDRRARAVKRSYFG